MILSAASLELTLQDAMWAATDLRRTVDIVASTNTPNVKGPITARLEIQKTGLRHTENGVATPTTSAAHTNADGASGGLMRQGAGALGGHLRNVTGAARTKR